ncbi:SDR family oxidoreductase [Actinoalloteichus hymeniacidonis]|uniref:NAD(P)-binding domain-containing protein n=1 Tax=Actinoalloteichus hymeniacidonis TaxID=340345 RepID=A0AAC9MZ82_9PSEU|nr:SDR family oxidoreductase [Actinoalloteichus hymeniacidonis]AOS64214.1 hypothetical protein TL08_17070 [Actinoalloteichus hymeniacidonis]MBB5907718.1 uncharacterized protein YbjT (DUF2867 family) [Actinoalloteichus hymeniacidonis]
MILITGATGTIGSKVLDLLVEGDHDVRAMTRDPARLRAYDSTGVDVVIGDFDRPDSLRAAVDGIDTVFLLTAPGAAGPDHDRALIEAAIRAGVGRVVKLSAIDIPGSGTGAFDWHRPGETALRDGGVSWTILRPAGFASNSLAWAESIRAGGPVPNMSGPGAQGIVDPRDVAEVAVAALLSAEHAGQTYTLTGPENISVVDQAALIGAELGRTVPTVDVPIETACTQMLDAGAPASMVDMAAEGFALIRSGAARFVSDDVERVLGRPARSFADWIRDHRGSFTG